MTDSEQIAQFIVEHVSGAQYLLGAKLGALVTAQFPNVKFKAEYGGLRVFVQRFCGDAVKITPVKVGPFGQDYMYAAPNATDVPRTLESARSKLRSKESAWRRFTVPDSPGGLWVNKTSGAISLEQPNGGESDGTCVEIPKSTQEEHRKIAQAFLPEITEADRPTFQQLAELPEFWRPWFAATRDFGNGRYSRPWAAFRFLQLCHLFTRKLIDLGISEDIANRALEHLRETKDFRHRPLTRAAEPVDASMAPSSSNTLRELARTAVESLSEEDLRRIWLPLGVISDVVRRRNAD